MSNAHLIVNKLLEAADPDAPEPYVDWLGQKTETGPLEKIRFGAHIHLSDEQMIRENAAEAGIDVDSQAFWDEVERCMAIMESHCLQLLREAGLHVSDEGHGENDARVASVWIDTPEEDRKLALLKAVINWAEGDWPSTTSGTMDYAFGADTTQRIYAMTEDAARFIDVTIEFTGTDALVEWSRLNLNEAIKGDPDDPEAFLRSYVPRMLGRLLIEFNVIKPHFPNAPANWYRENANGLDLFRYNRASEMKEIMRQMKAYNRQRGERAGIEQTTYRYKVPNPQGSSIVRRWLDNLGCPPTVIQWACETNPPIWFWVSVKEFNAYMQMVYPQVKLDPVVEGVDDLDDPEAFVKSYQRKYFKLFYGPKFGEGAYVGVYNTIEGAVQAAKERKLRQRARHVWISEEIIPDPALAHDTIDNIIIGSEPTANIYDVLPGYKVALRQVSEGVDDPDASLDPKHYLDAVTGWIDTFVNAGMTRYDTETHKDQLWKKYEVPGYHYWIYVNVREPKWIIVERNDALYGQNVFRRVFEFPDRDIKGMVNAFTVLDRKLTKARTRAWDDFPAVDSEIDDLYNQHKKRRDRWLSGKIKEAVDDPEVQRYLDQASPEACKSCGNDLTQRHSVVREYVQSNGLTHELSGHYDAKDSGYENDEQPSANLLAALPVCPTFNDLCARCGKDPNMPPQQESLDEPEQYLKGNVYTLDELREKLQNYGLSFPSNGVRPWGRWAVIDGFTYWAVYSKDPEKWLPQSYFREQLEKFCKDMGFTVYHIQLFGEYPEGITFKLAVPKMQIDPEAYAANERRLNDPDFREEREARDTVERDWLPEALPPEDEPEALVKAHIDPQRIITELKALGFEPQEGERTAWIDGEGVPETWIKGYESPSGIPHGVYVRFHGGPGHDMASDVYDGPNKQWRPDEGKAPPYFRLRTLGAYSAALHEIDRMMSEHAQREATPQEEVESLQKIASQFSKWHWDAFRQLGQFRLPEGAPDDPDAPGVNIDRHLASLDIEKIMADLGFYERWPSWKCADPEYKWFEKFVNGMKWTVIRKSDDEPQNFEVSISRPRKLPGHQLMDYQEVGGFYCHVGDLEAKLRQALDKPELWRGMDEALDVPLPPEDEPAPNIEKHAQYVEKTEADALDSAVANAIREFEIIVDKRGIDNARAADNLVGDLAFKWAETAGYANGSDEFDWLVSALNDRAGEMFPGNWEDYPVQESKETVDYPAVYVGGKIFIGPSHYHILTQLEANDVDVREAHHGWWTSRNRFLDTDLDVNELIRLSKKFAQRTGEEPGLRGEELPKAKQMTGVREVHEGVDDPDDPHTFIQNMETDWRKILRQHGFKPQPHSDHLSYVLTYPDRVWGANWPVNVYAHHGWNPHPEFEYDHADPDNPDIDAEDAAYDEWQRTHDEFAAIRERDVAFPDLIALQFGREGWRRIEVPARQLDAFLTRFTAGAKKVVGTETVASVHQGRGLTEMIWDVAKDAARELKVPVKESSDVPDPMAYATDTFNVPELLKRMGYQRSTREEIPFEWHKVFHRMPTELDLMVEVKRRGLGGEANEGDVVYDITLYQYPVNDNPNKQWMPLVYRYGRTNLQLERVLKKLEERIKANNLRGIRDEVQESVPIPPEDEPESVLPSVEKSLVRAELKRLDFGPKPERGIEWIYQEEMPRFWYNKYDGADGKPHGLYINFVAGQTPEIQTRNYNPDAKAWFVKGKEPPLTAPAESPAHLAAIVRDLDTTMKRCAAESLPPEQEYEALKRVIDHHRKWWEDTLDYLIAHNNQLPGRVGPGRPA